MKSEIKLEYNKKFVKWKYQAGDQIIRSVNLQKD